MLSGNIERHDSHLYLISRDFGVSYRIVNPPAMGIWNRILEVERSGEKVSLLCEHIAPGEIVVSKIESLEPMLPKKRCGNCIYFGDTMGGVVCGAFHAPDRAGKANRGDPDDEHYCGDWQDKHGEETVKPLRLEVRREVPPRDPQRYDAMVRIGELIARGRITFTRPRVDYADAGQFGDDPHYFHSRAEILQTDALRRSPQDMREMAQELLGDHSPPSTDREHAALAEAMQESDRRFRDRHGFQEGVTASDLLDMGRRAQREGGRAGDIMRFSMINRRREAIIGLQGTWSRDETAWLYDGSVLFLPLDLRPLATFPAAMPHRWRPPTCRHDITARELLVLAMTLPPPAHYRDAVYGVPRPLSRHQYCDPMTARFEAVETEVGRLWRYSGRIVCE